MTELKKHIEEAAKKEKYVYLSLNWPQAVLQMTFEPQLPQEQVVLQEANEGEQYGEGEVS